METDTSQWRKRWLDMAGQTSDRLVKAGLGDLVEAFTIVFRPLGPLAASILLIAEPMFGEPIGALARLLADEEGEENRRGNDTL
jgi:hypothetical protein